jgi:hypothetical protein
MATQLEQVPRKQQNKWLFFFIFSFNVGKQQRSARVHWKLKFCDNSSQTKRKTRRPRTSITILVRLHHRGVAVLFRTVYCFVLFSAE